MKFSTFSRTLAVGGLAILAAFAQNTPEVRRLTLTEAVHLALSQNRVLKIARLKVVENQQKKAVRQSLATNIPRCSRVYTLRLLVRAAELLLSGRGL